MGAAKFLPFFKQLLAIWNFSYFGAVRASTNSKQRLLPMTTHTSIRSGQVLIAEPFMLDPYFRRTVVLLCEHHAEGTVGFILNKKTDLSIHDLIEDFPEFDGGQIYYGGPVSTDMLHFVHRKGDLLDDSIQVCRGVWWGGDFDQLKTFISNGLIEPNDVRFFVGYSGWSGGQLNEEMEIGSWVVGDMDANYAFKTPHEKLWKNVMYNKGNTYEVLSEIPEDMVWN
jgi:putative transcriptional regulator